ncbi:MAG TPA: methyltransferase domain-containing protein, partial [Lacipirellulaceae bacterium]|nr:methyltransferase domain-containing protein [Lacipirellulaceae bacterium]
MLAFYPLPTKEPSPAPAPAPPPQVLLASGQMAPLEGLDARQLHQLQGEQEQKFARAIVAFPAGSPQRAMIVGQAYDTISTILAERTAAEARQRGEAPPPLVMGYHKKYAGLVLKLLRQQVARGEGRPRLFEIGYGCGALLKEVREHGFEVGGIEVSTTMRERAVHVLGQRYAPGLLLGDFLRLTPADLPERPTLIYWNDVLEHIPVDESEAYLAHIHRL